jgi:hypothetical protein
MTIWTNIPDGNLEPGDPIRSVDIIAIRDNPIAITEGASGAPKIQTAAIEDLAVTTAKIATNERITTANILSATAGANAGDIGSYAFLGELAQTSTAINGTRAGSNLRYVSLGKQINNWGSGTTQGVSAFGVYVTSPSGTWKCMGRSYYDDNIYPATVWLRIS